MYIRVYECMWQVGWEQEGRKRCSVEVIIRWRE